MGNSRKSISENISRYTINSDDISVVLINTSFPYEKKEPFLETEVCYYPSDFHVYIANCLLQDKSKKRDSGNTKVLELQVIDKKIIRYIKKVYGMAGALFLPQTVNEISFLFKQKRFSLKAVYNLLLFVSDGERKVKEIKQELKSRNISGNVLFFFIGCICTHMSGQG